MRVFISWSGEPSRSIAQALHDWLPMVVQHVEPWMSEQDIESGGRWNDQVAAELEQADYGIICLTSENIERPWLLFEAGALAKRFVAARVVPLLIDLEPADVTMPLASFQGRPLSEDGMLRLVRDMNSVRVNPLPPQQIDQLFSGMWPVLQSAVVEAIKIAPIRPGERRTTDDMLSEIVESVRRIERYIFGQPAGRGYGTTTGYSYGTPSYGDEPPGTRPPGTGSGYATTGPVTPVEPNGRPWADDLPTEPAE
jgi:hypothetical protein